MPSERLRLEMYKRLAEVRSDDEVDLLREEMLDRYGAVPQEVESLLVVARFRARARRAGVGEVTIAGKYVRFAPVSTVLVPRPETAKVGGRPVAGIALLEWARGVIDAVIDPQDPAQASRSDS